MCGAGSSARVHVRERRRPVAPGAARLRPPAPRPHQPPLPRGSAASRGRPVAVAWRKTLRLRLSTIPPQPRRGCSGAGPRCGGARRPLAAPARAPARAPERRGPRCHPTQWGACCQRAGNLPLGPWGSLGGGRERPEPGRRRRHPPRRRRGRARCREGQAHPPPWVREGWRRWAGLGGRGPLEWPRSRGRPKKVAPGWAQSGRRAGTRALRGDWTTADPSTPAHGGGKEGAWTRRKGERVWRRSGGLGGTEDSKGRGSMWTRFR